VPLNTIRLSLDSIVEEALPEDCEMLVSSMNNALGSMSETLNDVLSYQKIEEGKLELVPARFTVANELEKVLSVFDISVKSDQLNLRMHIDDDVPSHLVSDCHRIRQVSRISCVGVFVSLFLKLQLLALLSCHFICVRFLIVFSPSIDIVKLFEQRNQVYSKARGHCYRSANGESTQRGSPNGTIFVQF
jgi:hypothetical protein